MSNGFGDGPAQAVRDRLVALRARRVVTVFHPLVREEGSWHEVTVYDRGFETDARRIRLPFHPPLTYPLDLLVPLRPDRVDCWFGFNSLACARGLAARRVRRADTVVYWCVDFVPNRFGEGALTKIYDRLDRLCCERADARFELSAAARDARAARHRLGANMAPVRVVPMGAWVDRAPSVREGGVASRRIVYLGHLVPRQGVTLIVDVLAALRDRAVPVTVDIVGHGPLENELKDAVARNGLGKSVRFHGFVEDHRDVERILAGACVAIAPYDPRGNSFSRFADPGKLKAYLAAGLPIVLTDVPPNARDLEAKGAAEVVPFSASAFADAITRLLSSPEEWRRRRAAAVALAREFDWPAILDPAFASLGFDV